MLFQAAPFKYYCNFRVMNPLGFGARLLPGVVGGLMLSSDNPLDFHAIIVSVSQGSIVKIL